MIEKKTEKVKTESKEQFDLENQFILRLPEEPAKVLSEALQTGNLKDRMTIKLDNDLRYGEVCFDNWLFYAKVLDLPTIIECLKTIDAKSFYKSSDVCQIMICKEEQDEEPEKESPNKAKKKDPNKVDKKYLWPHGITPPCKNVRKRRFRKTLKKKNVDAPEIEKEVKRLLRIDNDAVKVEFEIINEDMDSRRSMDQSIKEEDSEFMDDTMNETSNRHNESREQEKRDSIGSDVDEDDATRNATSIGGVGEHDIFGEEVSSSDDDDERNDSQRMQDDDTSRLSADDTRISSYSLSGQGGTGGGHGGNNTNTGDNLFSKSMFGSPKRDFGDEFGGSSSNLAAPSSYFDDQRRHKYNEDDYSNDAQSQEQVKAKLQELHRQLDDLKMQKMQKSQEYSSIENPTLRQRMQDTLENLSRQITLKSKELADFESLWGVKQ